MLRIEFFVQGGEMESKRIYSQPTVLENFVVLEGLDGSGTTTQLHMTGKKLAKCGIPFFCTGEPTQGPVGRIIRGILKKRLTALPDTVALLFAADRNEHLYQEIEGIVPRIQRGELVVSDRYLFSSLAYQSLDCDPEFVLALNRSFPLPGHLVFLDTPVELSQQRLCTRSEDGLELYDGLEIQQDILSGYERVFSLFANTEMQLHRLDGSGDADLVFEKFWSILQSLPIVKG